jgi:hypothetical protein
MWASPTEEEFRVDVHARQSSHDAFTGVVHQYVGAPLPLSRIGRPVRVLTWLATIAWLLFVGTIAVLMVLDDPGVTHWMIAAMVTLMPPVAWHAIIQARVSGRMLRDWARGRGAHYTRKVTEEGLPDWATGDWMVPGWRRTYRHVSRWGTRQREVLVAQVQWTDHPRASRGPYLVVGCRVTGAGGARLRLEERSAYNRILGVTGLDDAAPGSTDWSSGVQAFDEQFRVRVAGVEGAPLDARTAELLAAVDGVEADLADGVLAVRRAWRSQLDPAVVDELCTVLLLLADDLEAAVSRANDQRDGGA